MRARRHRHGRAQKGVLRHTGAAHGEALGAVCCVCLQDFILLGHLEAEKKAREAAEQKVTYLENALQDMKKATQVRNWAAHRSIGSSRVDFLLVRHHR